MLHLLKILRIFPPRQDADRRTDWIYDPEWWDIDALSLDGEGSTDKKSSVAALSANAFPIVLFIGNVDRLKGLEFFISGAEESARTQAALRFVLVGSASRLARDQLQRLQAAGATIIDERPSDAGFVAHIRSASFLWACYDPEYDQSSGIFGRSLQLGIPSVVRRGSLLERSLGRFGRGVAVDYGDAAGLLAKLVNFPRLDGTPSAAIEDMRRFSISRLRAACGLQASQEQASNLVNRTTP
jgi:glycosyltransferase involved in cell wall biosynthesis